MSIYSARGLRASGLRRTGFGGECSLGASIADRLIDLTNFFVLSPALVFGRFLFQPDRGSPRSGWPNSAPIEQSPVGATHVVARLHCLNPLRTESFKGGFRP